MFNTYLLNTDDTPRVTTPNHPKKEIVFCLYQIVNLCVQGLYLFIFQMNIEKSWWVCRKLSLRL